MLIPRPWFRLYTGFAKDPKVQSMTEAMQRRLIVLFCLQCSEELHTLSEDDLAFALSITTKELQKTKSQFLEKGFISEDWSILNWDKRQSKSDFSRERTADYRKRLKDLEGGNNKDSVTVTSQSRHSDCTDIEKKRKKKKLKQKKRKQPDDENRRDQGEALVSVFGFEKFWEAYPNKVAKKSAEQIFNRLKPDEQLVADMLSALEKQKQIKSQKEKLGQFSPNWKNPSTWIRGQCWLDEPCSGSPSEFHGVREKVKLSESEVKKLHADLKRTNSRINKISAQISSAKVGEKTKLFESLKNFHREAASIEGMLGDRITVN